MGILDKKLREVINASKSITETQRSSEKEKGTGTEKITPIKSKPVKTQSPE